MPQIDAYDISVATSSGTLQSAAAATGNGAALPLINEASCVMTVSGTFVGAVTFEGTEDGTTWAPILAATLGSTVARSSTVTAPGTYVMPVVDLQSVRARISAYTSGAITVTAHASELLYDAFAASGSAAAAILANVAASASSVTIQAANAARKGLIVVNDSASATLYLGYQATTSATSYTEVVYPGQTWEMPAPVYNGLVSGIWSAAVGTARVTETS